MKVRDAAARTGVLRRVLTSRALVELGAMVALAVVYNTVRAGGGTDRALAMSHARDIVRLEGAVFRHLELNLDHWIVTVPVLAVAACYFYALMHYVMTPTMLVLSRRRGGWQYWRGYWALVVGSGIALVVYANWPLAPPRLMPELGTIDVMQHFAGAGWWDDAASAPRGLGDATNQFAAMPSLHFGWSLWCAIQMWGFGGRRWRTAAVVYPTLQAIVVLATANHFLLDVVGGAACILLGYAVVSGVGRILAKTHRPAVVARVPVTAPVTAPAVAPAPPTDPVVAPAVPGVSVLEDDRLQPSGSS